MAGPAGSRDFDPDACLRCGTQLQAMGVEEFRTGGTSGGWKLLFGEWAELGEEKLKLEIRACPSCRQLDFRVPIEGA